MTSALLDKSQNGIKIGGGNSNNYRYVDDTTPVAKSEEELKRRFMRLNEERENLA